MNPQVKYTSLRDLERKKALSQSLRQAPSGGYAKNPFGALAQGLNAYAAANVEKQAAAAEAENQQLQSSEINDWIMRNTGEGLVEKNNAIAETLRQNEAGVPEAMQTSYQQPNYQTPVMQQHVLTQALKEPKERRIVKGADGVNYYESGEQVLEGQTAQEKPPASGMVRNPDATSPIRWVMDPSYAAFQKEKSKAGATQVDVEYGKSGSAYLTKRSEDQGVSFGELEKKAESSWNQITELERFKEASKRGDHGGAAPIVAGVKNFLTTFGFDFDSLKDTAVIQQAIGSILGNKMAELGARGLTDKDMEILREALPRLETSHEAREVVADIMIKDARKNLKDYADAVKQENIAYPGNKFRRPRFWRDSGGTKEERYKKYGLSPL